MSRILIGLVKLYQKVAPRSIRGKCRYTPCCSDYMILAVEKYGFIEGVKKGLDRISRCKSPNGGIDYP